MVIVSVDPGVVSYSGVSIISGPMAIRKILVLRPVLEFDSGCFTNLGRG